MPRAKSERDLFPGALEMMILRTLKRQPLHGYALAQYIQRTSQDLLQVEEGSLYPALHRLERDKLLKGEWQKTESGRRARVSSLTATGRQRLEESEASFAAISRGIRKVLRFA